MALRVMTGIVLAALLAFAMPVEAGARGAAAVRKQAVSSLRVSGNIVIGTDGGVRSHELDPEAPLTPVLVDFIAGTIAKWKFEPVLVDGKPVNARVPLSLRLVAQPADDGKYDISIVSTYFGSKADAPATDSLKSIQQTPPKYPKTALLMGGKGVVYLLVEVGRDGKVANVDAEQVNLGVVGGEREMDVLRSQFTAAALRAAKGWTFAIPTTGNQANDDSWILRVPVQFVLTGPGEQQHKEGTWDTYIPGPRNMEIPWAQKKLKTAGSPDALPDDGIYPLRQGATLLTPLG